MKKAISLLILLVIFISSAVTSTSAITGETSHTAKTVYPGVTSDHYTLGSGTKYGLQDMTAVEFDPKQEGLSVNVATGYSSLNSLSTVSNTVTRWSAAHPDKMPLVAINGDWFTVSYDDYSAATSKKQLYLPLGFNMHGGEIVCTQQTSNESPHASDEGSAPSFGIAADGTPLIGCITTQVMMYYGTGDGISLNGINRLPSDNVIIMYTDKGPASNYCLDDAYELYVDFDSDYTVKHGMNVTGTVTAVSAPGEARLSMKSNRMIITARGTRIPEISQIPVGASLRFFVRVTDQYGNTKKWRTVTDCVGGHHEFARNGVYFNIGDATNYPANIIGITAEGKVIFLCNDGRQSGYSVGISINKMADLARELGIVSGIYMDGGGSTTMVQLDDSGGYSLVNRPCNNGHAERSVCNAVILSADRIVTDDLTFDSLQYLQYIGSANNCAASLSDGGLSIVTTTAYDPFLNLKNFGLSADIYKYIAFEASTNYESTTPMTIGFYLSAGSLTMPSESCKVSANLPASGECERFFLDLSSVALWNGDIHNVRVDVFDNFTSDPSAVAGNGVTVREMRFFRTLAEAKEYSAIALPGDANGDGKLTSKDISLVKRCITGAAREDEYVFSNCDVDGDGKLTTKDLKAVKRLVAS